MNSGQETKLTETVTLADALASRKTRGFEYFLVKKAARFLEKTLGTPLLIEPPYLLKELGFESDEPLRIAQKLYENGFIDQYPSSGYVQFPDEPSVFSVGFGGNSGGAHFFNKSRAVWSALGEYIERKTWGTIDMEPDKIMRGTRANISHPTIDPSSVSGFSEEQRTQHSNLRHVPNSEYGWIPTTSIVSGKKIFAPAQLLSAKFWHENVRHGKEPMLRWAVTTGLATGQTMTSAILRGALEVIERDAFMITYLNRLSPPHIDLDSLSHQDHKIGALIEKFKRYGLDLFLLLPPSDFDIPIVIAATVDRSGTGPALTVGAKADFNIREAILGALSESLHVRLTLKSRATLPDDFPTEKLDREERLLYWKDPKRLPLIEFWFKGPKTAVRILPTHLDQRSKGQDERELEKIAEMARVNDCEFVYAEIVSPEVHSVCNLRTVFVMSPQLQPLHLKESIPYLGGERLTEVPKKKGYTPAHKLNLEPHPFP